MNAEFQRIARRDKKAFLSDQSKETKENNRMGKIEISSRKLKIPRKISCEDGHKKGQKCYGFHRSRRYKDEVAIIHRSIQKMPSQPR